MEAGEDLESKGGQHDRGGETGTHLSSGGWDQITRVSNTRSSGPCCGLSFFLFLCCGLSHANL